MGNTYSGKTQKSMEKPVNLGFPRKFSSMQTLVTSVVPKRKKGLQAIGLM
jgi:hypothetical protein